MKLVVDSNIFVSSLDPKDVFHAECHQVAEQYGVPLLTKDKEMKRKSPRDILVFEPSDLPL